MARSGNTISNGANPGFEAKPWKTAEKLRSNMDTAEYKHMVPGLIILKNISLRSTGYFPCYISRTLQYRKREAWLSSTLVSAKQETLLYDLIHYDECIF